MEIYVLKKLINIYNKISQILNTRYDICLLKVIDK